MYRVLRTHRTVRSYWYSYICTKYVRLLQSTRTIQMSIVPQYYFLRATRFYWKPTIFKKFYCYQLRIVKIVNISRRQVKCCLSIAPPIQIIANLTLDCTIRCISFLTFLRFDMLTILRFSIGSYKHFWKFLVSQTSINIDSPSMVAFVTCCCTAHFLSVRSATIGSRRSSSSSWRWALFAPRAQLRMDRQVVPCAAGTAAVMHCSLPFSQSELTATPGATRNAFASSFCGCFE